MRRRSPIARASPVVEPVYEALSLLRPVLSDNALAVKEALKLQG